MGVQTSVGARQVLIACSCRQIIVGSKNVQFTDLFSLLPHGKTICTYTL